VDLPRPGEGPRQITYIVHRLRELPGANEQGFRNYMTMLEILSQDLGS